MNTRSIHLAKIKDEAKIYRHLTEDEIAEVKRLYAEGITIVGIAKLFKVCTATIRYHVCPGRREAMHKLYYKYKAQDPKLMSKRTAMYNTRSYERKKELATCNMLIYKEN